MNLQDKVIVITGGGQGLGRAMALHLAEKGAKPALIDMNPQALDETVGLCLEKGIEARAYVANITNEEAVAEAFDSIINDFGAIHGLVNNAGVTRDAMFIKAKDGEVTKRMSLQQWQMVIDVNLTGTFLCGREAATKMIESGSEGAIINISSISRAGNIGQTNYSASKAGVVALTTTWAKELARYGIRTGAIAPGFIGTEMVMSMKPEALDMMTKGIPAKRVGEPDEIAQAVTFILENDYFSGRVIEVDGALRL
ncbi:SDR family oxidoreductase [Motiliproteus sp. MSK22-1]|uniref:SDR family oxidoreductase n=1 Tax=Motiliproteus sp. MSK22-1 TaxID=1897630 RepID=UPI0009778F48|nr:SDR family oxidoreductase [Motiliproteus sp. MSK22-1]OMH30343.1 3-oxoacyl-ACP reductase [Motiliproteus sp. MSK22-1]